MRLLPVLIIALSVAAAACGGGDDDDAEPTATPETQPTARASVAAPTAAASPTAAAATAGPGPYTEEFQRLGALASEAVFFITYELTLEGVPAGAGGGSARWYQDPPRVRFDFNGAGASTRVVLSPEGNFSCENEECTDDTSGELDDALEEGFGALLTGTQATSRTEEQIAGYAAVCFDVEATREINFDVGRVCFSDSGLPLVLEGYAEDRATGGGAALVATQVLTAVPPAAFERP